MLYSSNVVQLKTCVTGGRTGRGKDSPSQVPGFNPSILHVVY